MQKQIIFGIRSEITHEKRRKYTDEFKRGIVERYFNGETVLDLCEETGIADANIYRWIDNFKRNGTTNRPRNPKLINETFASKQIILNLRRKMEMELHTAIVRVIGGNYCEDIPTSLTKEEFGALCDQFGCEIIAFV